MARRHFLLIVMIILCFITIACSKKEKDILRIQGSTTLEPLILNAKEPFLKNHNIHFEIISNGSHRGIEGLINGACDIAESSVEISPEEKERAKKNGVIIHEYLIARDLIVPVVHTSNPVSDVSLSDLRNMYSGRKKSWELFGGGRGPIVLIGRDNNSGTGDVWNIKVMKKEPLSSSIILKDSNSSVLSHVAEDPSAIGYISRSFINNEIKELTINGIRADISPAGIKAYPISRSLYLYANDTNKNPAVKSFIVFLLSKEGQERIRQLGFLPLGYSENN